MASTSNRPLFLMSRPRDDWAIRGRANRTAMPESLLTRLGRGDQRLFERMDRVSEPGRGVNDHIRELAFSDLQRAYREALCCKVQYLQSRGKAVHPRTMAAFENLRRLELIPEHLTCGENLE